MAQFLKDPIRHSSRLLLKFDCPRKFDVFAVSPDFKSVASGSRDGRIHIWDLISGSLVGSGSVPLNPVGSLRADEKHISTACLPIDAMAYARDGGSIICISGNVISEMDVETCQTRKLGEALYQGIRCMSLSPNSKWMALGSEKGMIHILDQASLSSTRRIKAHASTVNAVTFSSDGYRLSSASDDCEICVWDISSGRCVLGPLKHNRSAIAVAFTQDGQTLAASDLDRDVTVWNVKTGTRIGDGWHMDHDVLSLTFSHDDTRLVAAIAIESSSTSCGPGEEDALPSSSEARIYRYWKDANGKQFYQWPMQASIQVWDSDVLLRPSKSLVGHTEAVRGVAFCPDGKRIASASKDRSVRVWDAKTGVPVKMSEMQHSGWAQFVIFSPDGRRITSGGLDNIAYVWDAETGEHILELKGHSSAVWCGSYSPDGSKIVTGSYDGTLRLWDAHKGSLVTEPLSCLQGHVEVVAFSPSKYFASIGDTSTVCFWDAETGAALGKPLDCGTDRPHCIAFSQNGDSSKLAVGTHGGRIFLGDARTRRFTGESLEGHTGAVRSIFFSPDGARIYTSSDDTTIRCWDLQNARPLGSPLRGHSSDIASASMSRDGEYIVTGTWDNTVRIWDIRSFLWQTDASVAGCGLRGPERVPVLIPGDGWIRTPEGRLLLWIPDELRVKICDTSSICISADESSCPVRILWDSLHRGILELGFDNR